MEHDGSTASGFSLLEVMIAMLLVSFAMLAVGAAQLQSLRVGSDSDNRSQAMYLAESQLAQFLAMRTNDLPTACSAAPCNDASNPIVISEDVVDQTGNDRVDANVDGVGETTEYTRRWRVEPNTPAAGITRITVDVSWNATGPAGDSTVQLVGFK